MQLNSHLRLGKMLAKEYKLTGAERAAFLLGNVEPDLVFTSHLCRQQEHLEGHSFPAASQKLLRLCWQLQDGCISTTDYFKLGKLCHYTADCFTWPHNVGYPGNLSAHVSYEQRLDKALKGGIPAVELETGLSLPEMFFAAHEQYMAQEPSIARDLQYICTVTSALAAGFAGQEESVVLPTVAAPEQQVLVQMR